MTTPEESWYIVKQASQQCKVISMQTHEASEHPDSERWGPFKTQNQAIAKRVGLIRAGKCQPS